MRDEPAQDYADLLRLVATLRALLLRDPARWAVREERLCTLTALTQTLAWFRGGRQVN